MSSLIVRGSNVKMESSLGYVHWMFDVNSDSASATVATSSCIVDCSET